MDFLMAPVVTAVMNTTMTGEGEVILHVVGMAVIVGGEVHHRDAILETNMAGNAREVVAPETVLGLLFQGVGAVVPVETEVQVLAANQITLGEVGTHITMRENKAVRVHLGSDGVIETARETAAD